jgi:transcriptional regulator with XRE-family HTH domain
MREIAIDGITYVPKRSKPLCSISMGKCMRDFRAAYRWSLDKAATKIGISKTYLWELETGKASEPSFRLAVTIARIYNIDLVYFAKTLDVQPDTSKL